MIDFIHIGHGKSLSSSLQTVFLTADNYDCSKPDELIAKIKQTAKVAWPTDNSKAVRFGLRFASTDRVKVISSEGMVYGSPLDPSLPLCQRMMAQSFGQHASKALLIVRNPIAWIRSAYAQLLNEGASTSFDDYLTQSEYHGLANLNLTHILDCWRSEGVDVVILSMEQFLADRQAFWASYETLLGVPAPDNAANFPVLNASHYEALDVQRHLNELMEQLITIAKRNHHHDMGTVLNSMQLSKNWGHRRAMEMMSPEEAQRIRTHLGIRQADEMLPVRLGSRAVEQLRSHFIQPLEDSAIPKAIVMDYIHAIETACRSARPVT